MAVVDFVKVETGGNDVIHGYWTGNAGDTFTPIAAADWSDRSVQVFSADYDSSVVTIQGTNDPAGASSGTNYRTLTNQADSALSFAANADVEVILQNTHFLKPVITGGTGTGITIAICAKRS